MFTVANKNFLDLTKLPVQYSTLSPQDKVRVRLEYIRRQDNRCCYCNAKFTEGIPESIWSKVIHRELFPANFFDYPIHLHHCHQTGFTIGAIHAWCNAVSFEHDGI